MADLDFNVNKIKVLTIPELYGFQPHKWMLSYDYNRKEVDEKVEKAFVQLYGLYIPCLCIHDKDVTHDGQTLMVTQRPKHLSKIVVRIMREDDRTYLKITKQIPMLDAAQKQELHRLLREIRQVNTHESSIE